MATVKPPTPKSTAKPAGGKPTAAKPKDTQQTTWKDRLKDLVTGKTADDIKQKISDKASEKLTPNKLKDNSQIVASRLISLYMKQENTDNLTKKTPPPKILKGILKLMMEIETRRKLDAIQDIKTTKAEERELDRRHREIIKALSVRRKPEKKKVEEKKAEVKKEEKKQEEKTKTVQKKTEQKTKTTKPSEVQKPATETAKPATTTAKPATTTAKPATEVTKPATEVTKPATEVTKPPEVVKPTTPKATAEPAPAPTVPSPTTEVAQSIAKKAAIGTAVASAASGALAMPSTDVATAIKKASDTVGVGLPLMYAIAKQESGFDPKIGAETSSAKGLYQFIKGTWNAMVKTYGNKYPILKQRGPDDAEANALAGALYIKENSDILRKANIPVNATTIYSAHFLGPGGAKQLYSLAPESIAAAAMPKAASSNDFIFYKKGKNGKPDKSQPRTVKEVKEVLFEKVGQFESKYAQVLQETTGTTLAQTSTENKAMKTAMVDQTPANKTINNVSESTSTQQQRPVKVADDRSPYERVAKG